MIKAVIVDDEKNARDNLLFKIKNCCPDVEIIGQAGSMDEAVTIIHELDPQLVFLDIRLGTTFTGFDVLERLKFMSFKVIFTTSYDQYAIKAIRARALDYLLKPIVEKELIDAVHTTRTQMNQTAKYIDVPDRDERKRLEVKNIPYCQADDNCTKIYAPDGHFLYVVRTLNDITSKLPEKTFFRIHRSHIINRDYIDSTSRADGGMVWLKVPDLKQRRDRTPLSVSRNRWDDFMKWLMEN